MKIAIIIPAINLWNKYTKACIDSIKTRHEYRILLIDNASTDETRIEAGKLVSATFSHKRNDEVWSCAKSWNYGVKDAWERGFDYALILNNDVILHPDSIDRMVERFEQSKGIKVPVPTVLDAMMSGEDPHDVVNIEHVCEFSILGLVSCMDIRGECPVPTDVLNKKSEDYEKVGEAEHPNFSAYMISKECYDKVGEFDEGFFPAYFEDNDYHRRIGLAGMKAIVYPPALFYHYGSGTQNGAFDKPVVSGPAFERNREYYRGKWGGVPGEERFDHPFNYPSNSLSWTKQSNG